MLAVAEEVVDEMLEVVVAQCQEEEVVVEDENQVDQGDPEGLEEEVVVVVGEMTELEEVTMSEKMVEQEDEDEVVVLVVALVDGMLGDEVR